MFLKTLSVIKKKFNLKTTRTVLYDNTLFRTNKIG